jgi:hypothetical protein
VPTLGRLRKVAKYILVFSYFLSTIRIAKGKGKRKRKKEEKRYYMEKKEWKNS